MSRRYAGTRAGRNAAVRRARGGWRSARTNQAGPPVPAGDIIWSCPDCDGDLEDDAYAMWCRHCERTVPYALLRDDPEMSDDF